MKRYRRQMVRGMGLALTLLVGSCGNDESATSNVIIKIAGDGQEVVVHTAADPLTVQVLDKDSVPLAGVEVQWTLQAGTGTLTESSVTDPSGLASADLMVGTEAGPRKVRAKVGSNQAIFDLMAVAGVPVTLTRSSLAAVEVNAGSPAPGLGAVVRDSFANPVSGARVDLITTGGTLSQAADTSDAFGGIAVTLTTPATPGILTVTGTLVATGDTATWKVSAFTTIAVLAVVGQPANYGIHDTYVRDGYALVSAWNTGLRIYDVGNGSHGGTPALPVHVSTVVTDDAGLSCECAHNAWWFHDPVLGQARYIFVGQEAAGTVGATSSGDIHVLDVSDLAHPVEVAFYHLPWVGADSTGVHNFWMDEPNGILYAAYYNGGIVSLDVSGVLIGSLSARKVSQFKPSADTYIWGVMQVGTRLFATDMVDGLWSLTTTAGGVISAGPGHGAVNERFSSDLWVRDSTAYTGTWGGIQRTTGVPGNVTKIWALNGAGLPVLRDSLKLGSVRTVSDNEVSPGGELLLATAEGGAGGGLYIYERSDPLHPQLVGRAFTLGGLHTGTFAEIGGKLYVFAAKNPVLAGSPPALVIFDVTDLLP